MIEALGKIQCRTPVFCDGTASPCHEVFTSFHTRIGKSLSTIPVYLPPGEFRIFSEPRLLPQKHHQFCHVVYLL